MERISNAPHSFQTDGESGIVSLFTKISTDEKLAVIRDKLAVDPLLECTYILIDNLMEMLTFCIETTYFRMG